MSVIGSRHFNHSRVDRIGKDGGIARLANGYGLYEHLAIVAEIGTAGTQQSVDLRN